MHPHPATYAVGARRIELRLHAPHACVLPLYYAPLNYVAGQVLAYLPRRNLYFPAGLPLYLPHRMTGATARILILYYYNFIKKEKC